MPEMEGPKVEMESLNAHMQLEAARLAGLEGPFVLISYISEMGRGGIGQLWVVDRPGYRIDKEAHWALYGKKGFWLEGEGSIKERKERGLEQAKAWAQGRYGPVEWERNQAGDYLPAHINQAFPLAKKKKS